MGSYSFSGQNQEMVRRRANRKFVVIGLLAMVSIVALTIAVIVLAVKLDRDNSEGKLLLSFVNQFVFIMYSRNRW